MMYDGFVFSGFADEIDPMLDVQMEVLGKTQVRHIEMRGVDNQNIADVTLDTAKEIKQRLDANGFSVSALGSPIGKIGIHDAFAPHLDTFKRLLDVAGILDTRYIRIFSFYIPEEENQDTYKDAVCERLYAFLEAAKGYPVTLLHENEHGIYGNTAKRNLTLVTELNNPQLRLIFDPSNYVLDGETTYPDAYCLLAPHIEYFHIKDAVLAENKVVPSGMGDGHIREILQCAKDAGFRGFLSLEPHLGRFDGLAAFEHNLNIAAMPKGGPQLFMVAYEALCEILQSLH